MRMPGGAVAKKKGPGDEEAKNKSGTEDRFFSLVMDVVNFKSLDSLFISACCTRKKKEPDIY